MIVLPRAPAWLAAVADGITSYDNLCILCQHDVPPDERRIIVVAFGEGQWWAVGDGDGGSPRGSFADRRLHVAIGPNCLEKHPELVFALAGKNRPDRVVCPGSCGTQQRVIGGKVEVHDIETTRISRIDEIRGRGAYAVITMPCAGSGATVSEWKNIKP